MYSGKALGYAIAYHSGADMVTEAIDAAVAARGRCRARFCKPTVAEYTAPAPIDGLNRDLLGQQPSRIVVVDDQARPWSNTWSN